MHNETVSLQVLNNRIGRAIYADQTTQNVWVTAELSDVSNKNGHTYMELIEKDVNGNQVAKARAMIWRSHYDEIIRFQQLTGQNFCSGIKLKVYASATMHPLFGLSLTITAIDPTFTMGDLLIRRREILERLKKEGILNDNKNLPFNPLSLRIAVISAPEAAGYGDFMNHISAAGIRFRYTSRLFSAVMQGERAVPTILDALESIENNISDWDCVVIIRGGGATSDLSAFESYDLAYRIATYPLPVIVGIGHERDVTVLDYVANTRVKTPTAAADFLVQLWNEQLLKIHDLTHKLNDIVREKVNDENLQLSYFANNLNLYVQNTIERNINRMEKFSIILQGLNSNMINPQHILLKSLSDKLRNISSNVIEKEKRRLDNDITLLKALSPMAVLKRGYTITLLNGKTLTSCSVDIPAGSELITILHNGKIKSKTL